MGSQRELQNAKLNELTNAQLATLIDEWIRSERNRAILKRRLIDGICFEPLSEEFDLSVRQVKNIVYRSQDQLFRHIK